MKILNLFFLLIYLTFSAQGIRNKKISENVWNLSVQTTKNYEESFENGKKMLTLSISDEDRAKSYGHKADAKRKQMEYTKSIKLFEKADYYAKKSNFYSERLMIKQKSSITEIILRMDKFYP